MYTNDGERTVSKASEISTEISDYLYYEGVNLTLEEENQFFDLIYEILERLGE